jgi:hypothetical protein
LIVEDPDLGQEAIDRERDWHASVVDAGLRRALRLCHPLASAFSTKSNRLLANGKAAFTDQ